MDRTEFSNKNIIFRVNTELLLTNMFLEKINSDRRTNFLCYSVYYSSVKMSTSWQFFNRVDQEKPRIKQVECCGVSIQMTQFAALPIPKLRVSSFGAFIRRGPVLVVQRRAVGNHKISRSPKSCRLSLKKKNISFIKQNIKRIMLPDKHQIRGLSSWLPPSFRQGTGVSFAWWYAAV